MGFVYGALWYGEKVPGVTVATRHAPFGRSVDARGRMVHAVDLVAVDWSQSPPMIGARWACSSHGGSHCVELLAEPGPSLCAKCAVVLAAVRAGAPRGDKAVYYAERDGLIKIGISREVGRRVSGLGARLLAVEPGDWMTEQSRHRQFADHRVSGEWFHPAAVLMAHIESLEAA